MGGEIPASNNALMPDFPQPIEFADTPWSGPGFDWINDRDFESVSRTVVALSAVSLHYLLTPTLTLPLKGEGTFGGSRLSMAIPKSDESQFRPRNSGIEADCPLTAPSGLSIITVCKR